MLRSRGRCLGHVNVLRMLGFQVAGSQQVLVRAQGSSLDHIAQWLWVPWLLTVF
jgi:hypothetical protein